MRDRRRQSKKVGKRFNPEGASKVVTNIDNHRSERDFGGYFHDVPEIVSAEDLFAKYLKRAADTDTALVARSIPTSSLMSTFKAHASRNFTESNTHIKSIDEKYIEDINSGKEFFNKRISSTPSYISRYSYPHRVHPSQKIKESSVTDEFSQIRMIPAGPLYSVSSRGYQDYRYANLQTHLKPSLIDEDVVYEGENSFAGAIRDEIQFVMIGDTDHTSLGLSQYLRQDLAYLASLKSKGVKHVVFETNQAFEEVSKQYYRGEIDRETARTEIKKICARMNAAHPKYHNNMAIRTANYILRIVDACKKNELNFHFLDEQCDAMIDMTRHRLHDRMKNHEERLAAKIQSRVGNERTAIVYGSGHFGYEFTLNALLGDKSIVVNIHENLQAYRGYHKKVPTNLTYQPDYVYLVDEKTTVKPFGKYGRERFISRDGIVSSHYLVEQEPELQKFRDLVQSDIQARISAGKEIKITADEIIRLHVYWRDRSTQEDFEWFNLNRPYQDRMQLRNMLYTGYILTERSNELK